MNVNTENVNRVLGQDLYGADGDKIGGVGQVFLDDVSGEPQWVTVKTGLFGTKETFVPLSRADLTDDGLHVAYDQATIKDAPNVDIDAGHLCQDQEAELYRHYDMVNPDQQESSGRSTSDASDSERARRTNDSSDTTGAVRDTSDADSSRDRAGDELGRRDTTTDQGMTRSEEQLNVGTQTREAGRARLRKYVVTEEQTVTVPVSHEDVTLEREPITDEDADATTGSAEIGEEEQEIVLREERPVVSKETVPVERVALGKQTVADEEQVTETVRKEQIDTDGVNADNDQAPRHSQDREQR